jgi:hypothetical protein
MYKETIETNLDLFERAIMIEFDNMDTNVYMKEFRKTYNRVSYMKEHRTVTIGLPRQMGSTTLSINISKRFENPIFIVPIDSFKRTLRDRLGTDYKLIFTYEEFKKQIRGHKFDLVIFDCPQFATKDLYNEILKVIYLNNPKVLRVGMM